MEFATTAAERYRGHTSALLGGLRREWRLASCTVRISVSCLLIFYLLPPPRRLSRPTIRFISIAICPTVRRCGLIWRALRMVARIFLGPSDADD